MAKKSKWKGAALSLHGSIPFVGKVKKKAKAVKKAAKTLQKKVQTTKPKVRAVLKKGKNKVKKKKKKIKKKTGKVFTKARKLKNNLTKKDLVNKFKKIMKKEVLSAKATLKEIRKPVSKSISSFKEIGTDFTDGLKTRADKALNSPYDFANYMTIGGVDAVASGLDGLKERAEKRKDSVYDLANYWTLGAVETVKGAVNPDEPLSKEHWLNSIGVAGSIVGGTRVAIPKSGNKIKNKTKPSQKIEDKFKESNSNKNNSSKDSVKSKYTYNMVENPGPLAEINQGAASTFRSGMYNVITLEKDTILYRSGKAGGGKNALGQYFTREPGTKIEGRIDSAIKAQWIDPKTGVLTGTSPLEAVYEIKIPKGTTIYEGPAGYQGGIYLGGGNQIFVPEPWKINGVEVISSSPIK